MTTESGSGRHAAYDDLVIRVAQLKAVIGDVGGIEIAGNHVMWDFASMPPLASALLMGMCDAILAATLGMELFCFIYPTIIAVSFCAVLLHASKSVRI